MFVYLVKKHSVEELTKKIKQQRVIPKQVVIDESEFLDAVT